MRYRGVIQKGDRRASELGFPTINIALTDGGLSGIYAGVVRICDDTFHAAVYADQRRHMLEAHLAKYEGGELYGRVAEIELVKKIREDKKFDSEEALRGQIEKDVLAVTDYFRSV